VLRKFVPVSHNGAPEVCQDFIAIRGRSGEDVGTLEPTPCSPFIFPGRKGVPHVHLHLFTETSRWFDRGHICGLSELEPNRL
jgi:hypothetical protein